MYVCIHVCRSRHHYSVWSGHSKLMRKGTKGAIFSGPCKHLQIAWEMFAWFGFSGNGGVLPLIPKSAETKKDSEEREGEWGGGGGEVYGADQTPLWFASWTFSYLFSYAVVLTYIYVLVHTTELSILESKRQSLKQRISVGVRDSDSSQFRHFNVPTFKNPTLRHSDKFCRNNDTFFFFFLANLV